MNEVVFCEPSGPSQHSKMPRNPNLSKSCPNDCFSGLQSGDPNSSKIGQIIGSFVLKLSFFVLFDKFGSLIGAPKKTIAGTPSLDKFGVLGNFECCKGPEGSQHTIFSLSAASLRQSVACVLSCWGRSTTFVLQKRYFHKALGVFSPHLPCEIAEANFRRFQWFARRFSSTFNPFRPIFCSFQSVSVIFNQL